jgi:hypothetical protein
MSYTFVYHLFAKRIINKTTRSASKQKLPNGQTDKQKKITNPGPSNYFPQFPLEENFSSSSS